MSNFTGRERYFDGLIMKAKALEANDLRRQIETEQYLEHKQRNKPTEETHNKSSHSIKVFSQPKLNQSKIT
jgi:hypothetical protein